MTTVEITTLILVVWIVLIITLERLFPYRKGLPFLEKAFGLIWFGTP
jgi:hypothetical protein